MNQTTFLRERIRVLWIEDQAKYLPELSAPLKGSSRYKLVEVYTATDAVRELLASEFHVIIVDIRILPGADGNWISYYSRYNKDKIAARLGLALLKVLFLPDRVPEGLRITVPEWIQQGRDRFGVLTVESAGEIEDDLKKLGIEVYMQKTRDISEDTLLKMAETILSKKTQANTVGGKDGATS